MSIAEPPISRALYYPSPEENVTVEEIGRSWEAEVGSGNSKILHFRKAQVHSDSHKR